MKLIVGLGNPGRIYENTRHNVGFLALKALAKDCRVILKKEWGIKALIAKAKIGSKPVILAQPLSFMNLSGFPIGQLVKKYKIEPENLIIICDDLDLELGRLKIKHNGSSGGHKGLKAIIEFLGRQDFNRLRIGIGRPARNEEAADYVLSSFTRKEKEIINGAVNEAIKCLGVWVTQGINKAMNIFNNTLR